MGSGLTTRENHHSREIPELKALRDFSAALAPRGGARTSFISLLVNPDPIKNLSSIWTGFFLRLYTMSILVFYFIFLKMEEKSFCLSQLSVAGGRTIKDLYCVWVIHIFISPRLLYKWHFSEIGIISLQENKMCVHAHTHTLHIHWEGLIYLYSIIVHCYI